jgi:exonuclease SbcC
LFQTELHRRVEEYFKQSAKTLESKVKELDAQRNWTLLEAGAASSDELAARMAENSADLLGLSAAADSARQALQQAQDQFVVARCLAEQFADKLQGEERLAELAAMVPLMDAKRRDLVQAQRAALLQEVAGQVQRRDLELAEAAAYLAIAGKELAEAEKLKTLEAAACQRELERDKERADAVQRVVQLDEMQGKLAQLTEARQKFETALSAAQQAAARSAKFGVELAEQNDKLKAARQVREELQQAAAKLTAFQGQAAEAERLVRAKEKLDELRKEYKTLAQSHAAMARAVEQAEAAVTVARQELDVQNVNWLKGQAAALACSLEPGQPCPVCGSAHHPAPAASGSAVPAVADLELMQRRLRQQEADLEEKRKALGAVFARLEGIEGQGKGQRELLGDKAEVEVTLLRAEAQQACQELNAAQAAAGRLRQAEQGIKELENRLEALQRELEAAEQTAKEQHAALEAAKAVVSEREKAVPPDLRSPENLAAERKQAICRRNELEWALKQAREAAEQSAGAVVRLTAACTAAGDNVAALEAKLKSEQETFSRRIAEAGFANQADYDAALKPPAAIEALGREIQDYETALALAKDRVERAEAATAGLAEPDLAVAEAAVQAAQAVGEAAIAAHVRLQENIDKQKSWLNQLKNLDGELTGREEEYRVLGRLAEVANGQNPLRLSFHRFVLAALLEEVMLAANARLRKMSRGRYALRRMNDPLHKGMAGGLDIEIEDNWTGAIRHVTTLSGGESFLASLALALGLADVVQSFSGGIYLDTIFVDEGFGTLDPESLDMAMQALVELQYKGRLVGIISHVPELKERIEARLEIVPTERGSTTRWSALPGRAWPKTRPAG